jgi:hypothetical protein
MIHYEPSFTLLSSDAIVYAYARTYLLSKAYSRLRNIWFVASTQQAEPSGWSWKSSMLPNAYIADTTFHSKPLSWNTLVTTNAYPTGSSQLFFSTIFTTYLAQQI